MPNRDLTNMRNSYEKGFLLEKDCDKNPIFQFEKWFQLAAEQHLTSIIFIHGIGSGKLRDEIHSLLKSKNAVRYFVNQYDPRFGYGATEVFLT